MRKWIGLICIITLSIPGCGGDGDSAAASNGASMGAQKIIIDSDYNTISDDGQLGLGCRVSDA